MDLVNVFENDAFTMAAMSAAIQTAPTQLRELGAEGTFVQMPIRTETVGIEYRNGTLQIAPLDDRGAPITSRTDDTRLTRYFKTKRVARHDRLTAADLAFVRQFGSDKDRVVSELQKEIARRQTGPTGLISQVENRIELMRLGALKGLIVDHNGNTIYDFYNEFGISVPPTVILNIANQTEGALRAIIEGSITRPMRRKAKGRAFTQINARCGEGAWDALMANKEFRMRYSAAADAQSAAELHKSTLGIEVPFAGVVWREYFGADDGSSANLAPTEILFYPGGKSGIFQQVLAPGETFTDLGELGKEYYSYLVPDVEMRDNPRWVDLYVAQYPMLVNTAPDLVFRATSASS